METHVRAFPRTSFGQQPIDPGGIPPGPQPEGEKPYGVHPESAFEEWGGSEKAYGIIRRAEEAGFPVVHAFEGHGPDHVRKAMDYLKNYWTRPERPSGVPLPGEDGRLPGGGQPGGDQPWYKQQPGGDFLIPPKSGQPVTMAFADYYNKYTGETGRVNTGGYSFKPGDHGWVMGRKPKDFKPTQPGGQPDYPIKPPGNQPDYPVTSPGWPDKPPGNQPQPPTPGEPGDWGQPDDAKLPFQIAHPKAAAKEQNVRHSFVSKYGKKDGMRKWRKWQKSFRKRVIDAGGWQDPFEPPDHPVKPPGHIPDLVFHRGARR